jgi:hypothetical protein
MNVERSQKTELILALTDMVREDYEERFTVNDEAKRVRLVAIALFRRKWGDTDPNTLTMGFPGGTLDHLVRCGNGTVAITYPLQPAWATYVQEAVATIEAVDSAKP